MMADMPSITVGIESVIHDVLRKVLESVEQEHGIVIESLDASWMDISSLAKPAHKVTLLRIVTSTIHGSGNEAIERNDDDTA